LERAIARIRFEPLSTISSIVAANTSSVSPPGFGVPGIGIIRARSFRMSFSDVAMSVAAESML
jgi:hypothetical protein